MRATLTHTILLILALLSLALALSLGSVTLNPIELIAAISEPNSLHNTLVTELRLPRALAGFAVGAMLGLAGLLMQALLRNPLADPYILGISGGAAVAALLAILTGLGTLGIELAAFAGALLSIVLVFSLAHSNRNWTNNKLLLTGVVLAAGWNAMISFLLATSQAEQIHGMLFWLMGDLSHSRLHSWHAVLLLMTLLVSIGIARPLNLLIRGELQAAALGVNTRALRISVFLLASLLTASAISLAGSIGFIGLMTPHILRLILGSDHRVMIPATFMLGGTLLVLADTLARSLLAPTQLPVGILTAFIGVPVFLYLLYRKSP